MNGYDVLLFLHIVSVLLWLGAGTTLALIALYASRRGDRVLLGRLGPLARWLGPRVFGPAALGVLAFGLALVEDGHWTFRPLWIRLGLAAYAASFALNVGVRLPLMRRAERGGANVSSRDRRLLSRLPVLELAVLYLAVADMALKPSGADAGVLAAGGVILALAVAWVLGAASPLGDAREVAAR
jgi:uncharacterized membrane protein